MEGQWHTYKAKLPYLSDLRKEKCIIQRCPHPSQKCGDLASDTEVYSYLACHIPGTTTHTICPHTLPCVIALEQVGTHISYFILTRWPASLFYLICANMATMRWVECSGQEAYYAWHKNMGWGAYFRCFTQPRYDLSAQVCRVIKVYSSICRCA